MSDESHMVEVNGTELQITETEDGFEVTEVESEPTVYLRATSMSGDFGTQVPIDAEFDVQYNGSSRNEFTILFNDNDDVSELYSWNVDKDKFGQHEFDSGAYVGHPEIVVE